MHNEPVVFISHKNVQSVAQHAQQSVKDRSFTQCFSDVHLHFTE